jgi:hypothetical protein
MQIYESNRYGEIEYDPEIISEQEIADIDHGYFENKLDPNRSKLRRFVKQCTRIRSNSAWKDPITVDQCLFPRRALTLSATHHGWEYKCFRRKDGDFLRLSPPVPEVAPITIDVSKENIDSMQKYIDEFRTKNEIVKLLVELRDNNRPAETQAG